MVFPEVGKVLRSTHLNFRGKNVKNPLRDLETRDSFLESLPSS